MSGWDMIGRRGLLLGFGAVWAVPLAARAPQGGLRSTAQSYLDAFAAAGPVNGVVLVARNNRIAAAGAYGLANRALGVPITRGSRFEIASITKTFTALLVLRLADQGRIRLDAPIGTYLPHLGGAWRDQVTIRQLLEHRGGVAGDIGDFPNSGHDFPPIVAQINGDFFSLDELVVLIAARPLVATPGTAYSYSSDGYVLLGAAAAAVSGQSYPAALAAEILAPAGLRNTGYAPQTEIVPGLVAGYRQTWDGYENARRLNVSPAGGLNATAEDLLSWTEAVRDGRAMSNSAKRLAWQLNDNVTQYGWKRLRDVGAPRADAMRVQCSGALPGANALVTLTLEDGITIVALTNTRELSFRLDEMTDGLIAALRGQRPQPVRESGARRLAATPRGALTGAIARFGTIAQNEAAGRYVSEAELNGFGYHLLGGGAVPQAVAVLALNAVLFPGSANAHDSYGEALAAAGRRQEAIAAYERSLRLDPANSNARAQIQRLTRQ
jgi:CubicO group peptidase (beta-lactamase class C family)